MLATNDNKRSINAVSLNARFEGAHAKDIIKAGLELFPEGKLALVSSFGADSAVLLHQAAMLSKDIPVLFVDTGKLFGETRRYRDDLTSHLGLTNVQTIGPDADEVKQADANGSLWHRDADTCCHIRKVVPLQNALARFDAWISGRKRHQAATRSKLEVFESDGHRLKINPLADWSSGEILAYAKEHDLPPHPLVEQGFPSIGCMPCTARVAPGEDIRSGRWQGKGKTECGIHFSLAKSN